MSNTETFYNPRDKYYNPTPLARGPVQPTLSLGEFSRGVVGSEGQSLQNALNNYGKFNPQSAEMLRNFQGGNYVPGRYAGSSAALPAPASGVAVPSRASVPIPPPSAVPPGAVPPSAVPPSAVPPGALVPTDNVIEGQFTKVPSAPSAVSRALAYGGKALPFIGDVMAGYYASQDPDGEGPKVGGLGRGLAGGLGSFLGRTAGAGAAVATGPAAPVTALPLTIGGSIAGMEGGARLYDFLTAKAGLGQNPPPSSPEEVANYRLVNSTPAEQVEHETALAAFSDPATREELGKQNVFPGETSTPGEEFNPKAQVRKAEPVKKTEEKPAEFQGPSGAEMKRFRTLTGTNYDKNSVTDKLNLERMRAGEKTMTSKQSRQWRNANPTYRPGMYSRMKK